MPVFTGIGLAVGFTAAAAFAGGVAVAAVALGGAYLAGSAMAGGGDGGSVDSRVEAATGTGKITEAEAQTAAKKRAFRSGVLYTSPTGLDTDTPTSSAKLR